MEYNENYIDGHFKSQEIHKIKIEEKMNKLKYLNMSLHGTDWDGDKYRRKFENFFEFVEFTVSVKEQLNFEKLD